MHILVAMVYMEITTYYLFTQQLLSRVYCIHAKQNMKTNCFLSVVHRVKDSSYVRTNNLVQTATTTSTFTLHAWVDIYFRQPFVSTCTPSAINDRKIIHYRNTRNIISSLHRIFNSSFILLIFVLSNTLQGKANVYCPYAYKFTSLVVRNRLTTHYKDVENRLYRCHSILIFMLLLLIVFRTFARVGV